MWTVVGLDEDGMKEWSVPINGISRCSAGWVVAPSEDELASMRLAIRAGEAANRTPQSSPADNVFWAAVE